MPANKILLLMSDQHRPDLAGFAGNTVVRTPTLDWLAETGVVFENAYTPSPVCVPARQSILSGQIPSKCGCLRFGEDLPPNSMTYARQLARHGYDTVVAGKLHHSGPDQMQGWMLRIGHDNQLEERSVEGRVPRVVQPRSKVDPSTWWSWSKEIRRAGVGRSPHFIRDQYNVQGMLNYIEERFISPYYDEPLRDAPVLLKLGLNSPHYPYLTDEAKFKYYLNRVKPYDEEEFFDHPVFAQDWERVEIGKDVSFRDVRRATAAYYGLVEDMDSMCGTVLKALQDAGEDLDEWLIIYTSDHGEMLGQHGIWMKLKFFEASVRVPLIIRWPRGFKGGRRIRENVSLCDLFATFCDFAEVPLPENRDSRSLRPLLEGGDANWRNEAISQVGEHVMIKQDDLKYQYYGEKLPELLFDLAADPGETRDFSKDAGYQKAMSRFRTRLREIGRGEIYPQGR